LDNIVSTMTSDHIIAAMVLDTIVAFVIHLVVLLVATLLMWRLENLWSFCVLQRVHLSNFVLTRK
jgi:hypothetical protein